MGQIVSLDARRRARHAQRSHADARPVRNRVRFYFDLADAGTYLAAERADRLFGEMEWRPAPAELLPARAGLAMSEHEAEHRAVAMGMPLVWPDGPARPVRGAMRAAAHAAEQGRGAPFVLAAVRLAYCGGFDLDDPEVLAEAAAAAGLPLRECLDAARDPARDTEMEQTAARLAAAGADRLPALSVGGTLFCGESRVAEAAAARRAARGLPRQALPGR